MSSLFLLAGGGTGAKVAEALVHLCATGHGPESVHILFVDADTTNGNLLRARNTADDYNRMQKWPWGVRTRLGGMRLFGGGDTTELLGLFGSRIHTYSITQPVAETTGGSLRDVVSTRHGMQDVLDLLYDSDEQTTSFADGFRARPNLGCLVMAQHLREQLRTGDGLRFMQAMRNAGAGGQPVPIVVAASIFGGTGASLLPVARGCVEEIMREGMNGFTPLDHLRWGAVMMLPHYRPQAARDSVDPDRYLLDAAGALQFYSAAQTTGAAGTPQRSAFDCAYVVGSDKPSRNTVRTVLGFSDQANPAYFEEFIAAIGAVHFAEQTQSSGGTVRVYNVAGNVQKLSWDSLPVSETRREELSERFAYVTHLAAFFLRQSSDGRHQLAQGLELLLRRSSGRDLRMFPWYVHVLDGWAQNHPTYKEADRDDRPSVAKSRLGEQSIDAMLPHATRYFARLLRWADTALRGEALHLMEPAQDDYSALYSFMSTVKSDELDAVGARDFSEDNALVRLLRAALLGMVSAHENWRRGKATGGAFALFHGAADQSGRLVGPRVTLDHISMALGAHQLGDLEKEYTSTSL